ncbi:VCBS repeat-containing protein [Pseudofrankia sp. DC12]|uniref:FG-GAP repeat domain-containing protein n=1 Tax=Pseudofrankia sp. DC12 TaxID=683315 RepID=UPI000696AD0F|nr:VCBS repeat-containing protein [Pseudofrankia sp. DC12]
MNTPEQRDVLGPEELSRLLHAAVEPIRPSPEAYRRIQAGVERRGRWRAPLYAAGGLVLAGAIVLSVLLVRPRQQDDVVEVQPPINVTAASQAGGSTGPHPTNGPSSGGSTRPGTSTGPSVGPSGQPSGVTTSTGPVHTTASSTDGGSLARPTPVAWPAKPGDIDGDGTVDAVHASGTSVQVTLSRGGAARVTLPAGSTAGPSTALDLDDDGFAELIVQTGAGSGVTTYALARYLAPQEMQVVAPPPQPERLAAGTSGATAGWGFACVSAGVQFVVGTSSDSGQTFQVTTVTLKPTLTGGWVQQGDPTTSTMAASVATPSFVAHCGSLG